MVVTAGEIPTGYVGDRVGRRNSLVASTALLAVPTFLAMRAGDAMLRPVASRYLNDRIDDAGRATVLSAASMAYALVRVPLILAGGVVADAAGPLVAVAGFGGAFLVGAAVLTLVAASVIGQARGTGAADRS